MPQSGRVHAQLWCPAHRVARCAPKDQLPPGTWMRRPRLVPYARRGQSPWCRPPGDPFHSQRSRALAHLVSHAESIRHRGGVRRHYAPELHCVPLDLHCRARAACSLHVGRGVRARQPYDHSSLSLPPCRRPSPARLLAASFADEHQVRCLRLRAFPAATVHPCQRLHPSNHLHLHPSCRCTRYERQVYWGQNPIRAYPQPGVWLRRRRRGPPQPLARAPRCRPASSLSP